VSPLIDRDLETVCLKCLSKDAAGRYDSAAALADDLDRWGRGEPILARRAGRLEQARKWARRNPAAAGLLAACVLLVVVAAGGAVALSYSRTLEGKNRDLEAAKAEADGQAVQANRAKRELRSGLTRQVAERIEGDLGRFAAVGDALGATATAREDWTKEQLGEWMEDLLRKEPQVFGLTLVYEAGVFPGKPHDYIYKCRKEARGREVWLKPLKYDKPIQKQDWYLLAKEGGKPAWCEPFVDTGGGEIPMVAYVVPMFRRIGPDKQFIGVMTVDLSLTYFDQLRKWLTDLDFGPRSYGFAVSQTGNVLSHPHPDYDFGARFEAGIKIAHKITDPVATDPVFAALVQRMLDQRTGEVRGTDPTSGRPATFLFAPVRLDRNARDPDRWTFVTVIEE